MKKVNLGAFVSVEKDEDGDVKLSVDMDDDKEIGPKIFLNPSGAAKLLIWLTAYLKEENS